MDIKNPRKPLIYYLITVLFIVLLSEYLRFSCFIKKAYNPGRLREIPERA